LDLEQFGSQWSPLYGEKSWNVFIKNCLFFFSTEERKTWTSWTTWGWVNYQQKFFFVCLFVFCFLKSELHLWYFHRNRYILRFTNLRLFNENVYCILFTQFCSTVNVIIITHLPPVESRWHVCVHFLVIMA